MINIHTVYLSFGYCFCCVVIGKGGGGTGGTVYPENKFPNIMSKQIKK